MGGLGHVACPQGSGDVTRGTALVPPTTLEAIRDDTTLTPDQRELLRREYVAVPANESADDSAREWGRARPCPA